MSSLYTLQVDFHGLCAAVTEGPMSQDPKNAHIVLPDPKMIKHTHATTGHVSTMPPHRPVLVFHAEDFESEEPHGSASNHSVVTDNAGTLWGILPLDELRVTLPGHQGDLDFDRSFKKDLPSLEAIAQAGKIRQDCVHKPKNEPISSVVDFAHGGTLFARNKTTEVWSFGDPGPACFPGKHYAMNVTFIMHSTVPVFRIDYYNFKDQAEVGYLSLTPKSEFSRVRVSISNHPALVRDDGSGGSQHSAAFFKLSEKTISNPPMPKPTPDCKPGAGGGGGGGIGCTPFLMYV